VTFLFTDLEGSTRLWEEHPDAMRVALARHDEILRLAISEHGGYVVKMTGDGVHASFVTAEDALAAAIAGQRGVANEAWGETGALRVRMGLHTGAADVRDGDYYGSSVNRAARVMAAAHGGQVVVSHATEEVARASWAVKASNEPVRLLGLRMPDAGH
jgi:class 3 adenylate cyclase